MANVNSPFGLQVFSSVIGADMNGKVIRCSTQSGDATAIFIGDPVKLAASQANAAGMTEVTAVSGTTDFIYGVVVGIDADGSQLDVNYRKASTVRTILVNIDPNTVYVAQANGALAVSKLNQNISWKTGSGNTSTGISGITLDDTTAATTNTLQFKMLGAWPDASNTVNSANNKVLCKINKSQIADQIAGV